MQNDTDTKCLVGNNAIKMACLQVNAGKEFDVAKQLKDACKNQPGIVDFALMKGFGVYDIILLYEVSDFNFHLSKAGPIPGIIASNSFLCFPFLGNEGKTIFKTLKQSTFVGLSFIKFNEQETKKNSEIVQQLSFYFESKKIDAMFLGTIGWNEIIVLLGGENIQGVASTLLKLNYDEDIENLIEKTTSTVAIKYSKLPALTKLPLTKNFLESIKLIERELNINAGLCEMITPDACPRILISSKPLYYSEIKKFWKSLGFTTADMLGNYDIRITINKRITWKHFISSLLYFRWEFQDYINSTCTNIEMANNVNKITIAKQVRARISTLWIETIGIKTYKSAFNKLFLSQKTKSAQSDSLQIHKLQKDADGPKIIFHMDELTEIFGNSAPLLANHFYSLSGLLQDPIKSKAFNDMLDYPNQVINMGRQIKERAEKYDYDKDESLEGVCMKASIVITSGSRLRSYGIYGNTDLTYGVFSELRGGVQLALNAIEYIPAYILHRLNLFWHGFITVEDPKFSHLDEVISVPSDAFWRPDTWWAIYHETAHILLSKKNLIDKNDQVVKNLLRNKKMPDLYMESLIELSAEVIGYELGFFNDFSLYFETLLQHLSNIESTQKKHVPMDFYLQRTFFVEIFSKYFRQKTISDENFKDEQFLFKCAIEHLNKAQKIFTQNQRNGQNNNSSHYQIENVNFLAAQLAINMVLLNEFAEHLNDKIQKLEETNNSLSVKDSRFSDNTNNVFEAIKAGYVWDGPIECLESVLYRITKESELLDFRSSIATILTFHNLTK